ncbi:hypothetical protein F511_43313 [Dorcoceras hygrometricum]|uniref:Uncharacterized protein n=1 Tax=Dorcoceras hygrometricum TaxID=472368 RepID=A0A2Z7CRY6_9LAMI|nr:hypothetical protein F511_43313 [Dorcoceras hygrometricum]
MRSRGDKRPSRKHDRKVLMVEESTKSWADTDSDSSSSSSSSSDSEQEEVHCLMADQMADDELTAENDVLKNETSELKAEIEIFKQVVSDWNRSSRSLHKMHESQKLANDKSGLGLNSSECSEGETSTQSQSAYDKFNKMSFVKANVIYDCHESITYDDQNSPKLNDNGKAGIGFSKPEISKTSWLNNKLDTGKAKAGQKPFVPNQPWRCSKKVKTGWKNTQPGSFNAITVEKFSMVTAVVCGIRMNWASILFSILKNMVTLGSKQAKGFAVQISLLLENIPNLELGESSEFPSSKILTEKTVHRFVSLNDKVGAEEAAGAPNTKVASKKSKVFSAVGAPVIKKRGR